MSNSSHGQDLIINSDSVELYKQRVARVLEQASAAGATAAEASLSLGKGLSVSVRLGEVETVEHNRDQGLAVTVYIGKRKGSASSTDLSDDAIAETVNAACDIARVTSEDPCNGLADTALLARNPPDLDLYHQWQISVAESIDVAQRCESAALNYDKRIKNSEGASLSSQEGMQVYGNSNGFLQAYPTSRHSVSCSVIAEDGQGMERDYWYSSARCADDLEAIGSIGTTAASRAIGRLNPRRLSTRQAPVVFAAEIASGLFSSYISAISGSSQYRNMSFLLNCLEQAVFPDYINIREEPWIKRGLASAPYDNEGVATQARDIVAAGVAKSYILGSYSACKLGMQTTGNAGGVHNLVVSHGVHTLEKLLTKMGTGLFVTELMGQGINRTTGDYSRGAAGFWVEDGSIQYPVSEITIAGNLKDMFRGIVDVATDVDTRRSILTGSVLIDNMTIAGE